jgi:hypothetical protein
MLRVRQPGRFRVIELIDLTRDAVVVKTECATI